jgi:hypothetical protein
LLPTLRLRLLTLGSVPKHHNQLHNFAGQLALLRGHNQLLIWSLN